MSVILLNGPSSAGKTTIMKELQKILPEPFLAKSLDEYIVMLPEYMNDYNATLAPHKGFGWVREYDEYNRPLSHLTPGEYGIKVYDVFKLQIQQLAQHGFHVIVDNVALTADDYQKWKEHLNLYTLFTVKIDASPEVLDNREKSRCDRVLGVSRALQQTVHRNYSYDYQLDTTTDSPSACAKLISEAFYKLPMPDYSN